MSKINVKGTDITVVRQNDNDYICITDMVKSKKDDSRAADVIKNWLRTRSTIEFLGTWEKIYNPNFKVVEFDHFKSEAGLPTFTMSVINWVDKTEAIGIFSKAGKYGGTYAHKDIAFEFGTAISPEFKLLLIQEFQRLKDQESKSINSGWDVRRFLSKSGYKIQTDAIKDILIPLKNAPKDKQGIVYAEEADLLYQAMFGYTSKQWRDSNPELVLKGDNLREYASIHQLIVLNNLEILNAELIRNGMDLKDRLIFLRRSAINQAKSLNSSAKIEELDSQSPKKEILSTQTKKPSSGEIKGKKTKKN